MGSAPASPAPASPVPAAPPADAAAPVIEIRPTSGLVPLDARELFEYRELLYFLTWRDIKVRYKQTVLGALWAVIQPLFSMAVFTVFFGSLAKIPSDGAPYALFSYVALVPWTFFANAMSQAGNSLVGNQNLISKVYFPRLVIPISATLSGIVDLAIALLVLLPLLWRYGYAPGAQVLLLPAFVLLALAAAVAVGLWLSALNVEYRDVRYAIPFLVQVWMFGSPIVYPSSLVPERFRDLYALNPMVGVIEGFRWALLGTGEAPGRALLVSTAVVVALFVGGAYYFRRMERTFADLV